MDMYDGGNRITTSLCTSALAPYTDGMALVPSACFGEQGSYMMDLRASMMVLVSQNTGNTPLTITISGDLGADGGGQRVALEFTLGELTGYMTSVCAAGNDPSVNHLFIINSTLSSGANHMVDPSTNSDNDQVSGIGVGSPIVYILYASTAGGCHSDDEHRAIFEAAALALRCAREQPMPFFTLRDRSSCSARTL